MRMVKKWFGGGRTDSDEDPDCVPQEQDLQIGKEISEVVKNTEKLQIPTAQSRKWKNDSKSKTYINGRQIKQIHDINKYIITVPNTSKIVEKKWVWVENWVRSF